MAASSIVVNSINPNLYILGDNQKLFFSDPTNNFSFISNFTPILNVPSLLKIGIFNVFNNGYVFEHLTTTVDNFGPLKLKSILNNNPVELLSINNNIFTFSVPVIVPNPTLNSHAANKYYIDNKTWTVSQITDFNSSVLAFKLNQFALPISNIDLNGNKIIGLGTPTLTTDGANKSYVDEKTWIASQITDFDTQVRLSRLDQMALPTISLNANSQKIINLAAPVLSTDAVNKNYADTSTIAPSRITNFPNDSTKYLSGNGNWTTPAGGGDTYQTLTSASSVTWNADNGNIAILTLSTNVTLNINIGLKTRLVLIVKQDNTGNRTLTLPSGIYRFSGSSSVVAPITTTANAIDVLIFIKDEANKLYLQQVNNNFTLTVAPPTQNFIQVNSPFGSSTYVSQSIIQNWYNSYSGNPSPNTANPASVYPGLVAVSGWCIWLGSTNWYYASGSWNNMSPFGNGGVPGDFAANIAAIARGL